MTDGKRLTPRQIPRWVPASFTPVGVLALAAASQAYRYAHGTALLVTWIACGGLVVVPYGLSLWRDLLNDQRQRVRVEIGTDRPVEVPDYSQVDLMLDDWELDLRAGLLGHLQTYREPHIPAGLRIREFRETRTEAEYRAEVESHIKRARGYLTKLATANYAHLRYGLVRLWVKSESEGTLENVRLAVTFDGCEPVILDPEEARCPKDLPSEVRPYGVPPVYTADQLFGGRIVPARMSDVPVPFPAIDIDQDGALILKKREIREDRRENFAEFCIIVRRSAGTSISVQWSATAKNLPGLDGGRIIFNIADVELPRAELLKSQYKRSMEQLG